MKKGDRICCHECNVWCNAIWAGAVVSFIEVGTVSYKPCPQQCSSDTDAFRTTCLESLHVRRHFLLVGCVRRSRHAFSLDHSLVTQMLQEFSHLCREGKVVCLPFVTWRYIPIRQRGRRYICQIGRCARSSVMVCCDVRTALLRVVSLGMMNGSVRRAVSCELVNQPDMCDRLPASPSGRRNSLPRALGLFTFTFPIGTTAW